MIKHMVSILGLEHPACEGKKCSYPKADSLVPMDATKLSVTCSTEKHFLFMHAARAWERGYTYSM